MKNRLSNILTIALVAVLIAGAVCIGGVKGYQQEREKLLLACMERHTAPDVSMADSIAACEAAAADFDARLNSRLRGRVSAAFGVAPISDSVRALHDQLLGERADTTPAPDILAKLGQQVGEMLEDNIDTALSVSKAFWTFALLMVIFRGRRGFRLGQVLAGFGLFRLWRKK